MTKDLLSPYIIENVWLPILVAVIAGTILIFINAILGTPKNGRDDKKTPQSLRQSRETVENIVYVKTVNKVVKNSPQKNNKDSFQAFAGALLFAGAWYSQNEMIVLNTLTAITSFLIALWLFTLIHAYLNKVIHGRGWLLFLLSSFICTGGAYVSISMLANPIFVPEPEQLEGLLLADLIADVYKVMGAILTLSGLVAMFLTMVHYIVHINVVSYENPRHVTRWVLRKTYFFANPLRMGFIIFGLLILACVFTSGYVHYLSYQR